MSISEAQHPVQQKRRIWSYSWRGLQAQMALSYIWVSVVSVLVLESLAFIPLTMLADTYSRLQEMPILQEEALLYSYAVSNQTQGMTLDANTIDVIGKPTSRLVGASSALDPSIPYINTRYPETRPVTFVLLINPTGQVLASSYPQRYPISTPISRLFSKNQISLVAYAQQGLSKIITDTVTSGSALCVGETVWNRQHQPIGVIYLQSSWSTLGSYEHLQSWLLMLLISGLILLAIAAPIGGLFGMITTRKLVRRVHKLVDVTTTFARGNYRQRVNVLRKDEVGQLEQQFNHMADQLDESIAQQQRLAEQNARMAERERIARELHDAISQDLFSLRVLASGLQTAVTTGAQLQPYIDTLEQATAGMVREMRALFLELRPAQLEELGLLEALEELATAYSTRLGLNVMTKLSDVTLDIKVEHALFRIAQEALANAARHADATTIIVELQILEQSITLTIADNGKGFVPTEKGTSYGLGLRLMEERAQEINGTCLVHTIPGQGTQVSVYIAQKEY